MGFGGLVAGAIGALGVGTILNNKAARKQARAYNDILAQQRADAREVGKNLAPYMDLGEEAAKKISLLLLGKAYDPATGKFSDAGKDSIMSALTTSPSYQFRLDTGNKALEAKLAASGNRFSGSALKQIGELNQNIASDEFYSLLNSLGSLAGSGQQAATSLGGFSTQNAPLFSQLGLGGLSYGAQKYGNWGGMFNQIGQVGLQAAAQQYGRQNAAADAKSYFGNAPITSAQG